MGGPGLADPWLLHRPDAKPPFQNNAATVAGNGRVWLSARSRPLGVPRGSLATLCLVWLVASDDTLEMREKAPYAGQAKDKSRPTGANF